jgi:catechol 2,3-dioxygenase-like lactoylglutathione lyase family enzyme
MLDHMILTVSDVERSLAFYEAALKPLDIKFFMPYKGEDGHPDLWGFGDGKRAFLDKAREARSSGHSLGVRGRE